MAVLRGRQALGPGGLHEAGERGPLPGLLAAALLLDEGAHAPVHGAKLAADLAGEPLGLDPLGVQARGRLRLVTCGGDVDRARGSYRDNLVFARLARVTC
jgi:hypothetical protein